MKKILISILVAVFVVISVPSFATAFNTDVFSSVGALQAQETQVRFEASTVKSSEEYRTFVQRNYTTFLSVFAGNNVHVTVSSARQALFGMNAAELGRVAQYCVFLDHTLASFHLQGPKNRSSLFSNMHKELTNIFFAATSLQ